MGSWRRPFQHSFAGRAVRKSGPRGDHVHENEKIQHEHNSTGKAPMKWQALARNSIFSPVFRTWHFVILIRTKQISHCFRPYTALLIQYWPEGDPENPFQSVPHPVASLVEPHRTEYVSRHHASAAKRSNNLQRRRHANPALDVATSSPRRAENNLF
jgi:hypothetical protein